MSALSSGPVPGGPNVVAIGGGRGLVAALGSIAAACGEAARIVQAVGSVFPATTEAVTLRAEIGGVDVDGQVAIQQAAPSGRVRNVRVVPEGASASAGALGAIMEA